MNSTDSLAVKSTSLPDPPNADMAASQDMQRSGLDSNAPLSVTLCTPNERKTWNDFVRSHPFGNFYHLYEWSDANRRGLGLESHYLIARRGHEATGVLPLTFVSSPLFGRILCSMPFVNFGGPCHQDDAAGSALLAAATETARTLHADYIELRCAGQIRTDWPVSHRKISMKLTLNPDPDVIWNAFTSKHRTAIRRSYKNDLSVRSGGRELLPLFYQMMQVSWRALGTPLYHPKYFDEICRVFGDGVRIFICYQGSTPIAAALNGYFKDTVEGMWAGGTDSARTLQANYVLYWEMIKDACERGYVHYHLGRSTADSGAEDFKKKWNATSSQLHWYYHLPSGGALPGLNVDNPKYKAAIAAWQRLPLWMTRLVGPHLARLIP